MNSLRGSPALGFGMTFFSGRQLTRLPTFTLTWPFLHFFFLAAESAGTTPNDASAAEGAAAGAATTSAPTQARKVRLWSLMAPATLSGPRHPRNGGIPELC